MNTLFTPKEVLSFNAFQLSGKWTPLTCVCGALPFALDDGLHCPDCGYNYLCAYPWMLDWRWDSAESAQDYQDANPSRIVFFESFAPRCHYFHWWECANPCGCDHPEQDENDDGRGLCYSFSCPIGTELLADDYPEDREILVRAGVANPEEPWLLLDEDE